METKSSGIENDPWDTISTTVIEIYQSLLSTYTFLIKKNKQTQNKHSTCCVKLSLLKLSLIHYKGSVAGKLQYSAD